MLLESGWYHPDLTCILKDQKDPSLEIRQELHKASDATDFTLLTNSIDRATRTLSNHAATVHPANIGIDLPQQTKILQKEINTCYDLINTMLKKSKQKLTHYNLQVKISELYLSNVKTITRLIDIKNNCNPKKKLLKFKKLLKEFKGQHHHLNVLFNEQKDCCQKLINNYTTTATDINIQRQEKRAKTSKEAQPPQLPSDNPSPSTEAAPPSASSNTTIPASTAREGKSQKIQPAMKHGNHRHRKETISTL